MLGDFRIGEWLVQPQLNQISGNGKTTRVEPKAMQVLVALAEHHPEVVSKEKLMKAVWADTFVTDDVLTRCISELRKAFDDAAHESRVIATIPKGGYWLLLAVHSSQLTVGSSKAARVKLVSGVIVVIAAGFLAWRAMRPQGPAAHVSPARVMLAVLPCVNLNADPEQEYFSDGMTEETIRQLGALQPERMAVIARTSVMPFKGTKKGVREIGHELGVDYILECSAQRAVSRVRISAQLIQVRDQTQLWAGQYDRELRDVLAIENEVAAAIAHQVGLKLTPQQQARLSSPSPVNAEAFELYLKGRWYWNKRTFETLKEGTEYFERAIKKDPTYALGYVGLADSYMVRGLYGHLRPEQAFPKSKSAAMKALELDGQLGEAHVPLGAAKLDYEWDWPGAEKELRRALELKPGYANAHLVYSRYLAYMGRPQESLEEIRRAQELDPLSVLVSAATAARLNYARQFDRALKQAEKTLAMDPNYQPAHSHLGASYQQMGKYEQAISALQKAVALDDGDMDTLAGLGHAYAVSGRKADAQMVLQRLKEESKRRYVSPADLAIVYAGLGDTGEAMRYLEKAHQLRDGWMAQLKADPGFDPLRGDPRFQDLLRRMNFPK